MQSVLSFVLYLRLGEPQQGVYSIEYPSDHLAKADNRNLSQSEHLLLKALVYDNREASVIHSGRSTLIVKINFSVYEGGYFQAGLKARESNQLNASIRTISAREFKMFVSSRAIV